MTAITNHTTLTPSAALRAQYDKRSPLRKVVDLIVSLFRQVRYTLTFLVLRICSTPQRCGEKMEWKVGSEGLVVLLHGLRSDPVAWYSGLSLLRKEQKVDVFAPVVPKRGMCSLEEAATPILPTLVDYVQKNPKKPICLLGVSNGSRIAMWLETKLRKAAPETRVKVSTISGVHFGSSRMDLLERVGMAKFFYPKTLRDELKYGSVKAQELQASVKAPFSGAARSYEFYAALDDLAVPDLDSSLPTLGKGERFHVLQGHSHDSVVDAVAKQQIASCLQWIR